MQKRGAVTQAHVLASAMTALWSPAVRLALAHPLSRGRACLADRECAL